MYSHASILAHVLEYIGIVLIELSHYFSTVAFLKAEYSNMNVLVHYHFYFMFKDIIYNIQNYYFITFKATQSGQQSSFLF